MGGMESCGIHETVYNSIMKCDVTSGRTCTPTLSCPEAPPCTPVLLTVCRRRSPPWLHPGFPLHLPADVDLQTGVRRVRPWHRPQEVLLSCQLENLTQSLGPNLIQLLFSVLPFFVIIEYNLSTVSMNKKFV